MKEIRLKDALNKTTASSSEERRSDVLGEAGSGLAPKASRSSARKENRDVVVID